VNESNTVDVTADHEGISDSQREVTPAEQPERIGRYRIEKVLGQGGFGLVYLAHDEQLNRPVAIKVPHASLISQPEDAEAYLAEARTVANLDHPAIVPVYDAGSTETCPCFIVSKYIEGIDLAKKLKQQRPHYREAAELVATLADALHFAHKHGLVHRDVKPGNILIGSGGKPYVVDFGLALREENIGKGPRYAGTPA
jgi:serine/threonine protein kinase